LGRKGEKKMTPATRRRHKKKKGALKYRLKKKHAKTTKTKKLPPG
jgi:hypothetical protein